jgi:formate hydrogenlyase transcriptional activator
MEKEINVIPSSAIKKLTEWHWPGNIRELQNFVERAVILTRGSSLQFPLAELRNGSEKPAQQVAPQRDEREEVLRVLKETNGRVGGPSGAAARLGLKRTTLISRMKKLGIDVPRQQLS